MNVIQEQFYLSAGEMILVLAVVFLAGIVRGFAGFGLSAIMMAGLAILIPPIDLIPICFVLETTASLLMFRGGMQNANMKIVLGLVIGSAIGVPIGLYVTTGIDKDLSRLVALFLVLSLTIAQLFRLKPKFLATRIGLYASGLMAGIATGLASVGGMVVALYVLASDAEPKQMRASLVMYLFLGMFTSLIYLIGYEVMTVQALWRALLVSPFVVLGVFTGAWLFRPDYARFYKSVCLFLLVSLALVGLVNQLVSG